MMETVHYDMMVASHRSRLENTSEDWSSLLASLRELTEWVGNNLDSNNPDSMSCVF